MGADSRCSWAKNGLPANSANEREFPLAIPKDSCRFDRFVVPFFDHG